jgi:hypothetical protein
MVFTSVLWSRVTVRSSLVWSNSKACPLGHSAQFLDEADAQMYDVESGT